jgi:hypothetical protein
VRINKELNSALKDFQSKACALEHPLFYTADPFIAMLHEEHRGCILSDMHAVHDEHDKMYEDLLDPVGYTQENADVVALAAPIKTALAEVADALGARYSKLIFDYWDEKQQTLNFHT